MAREDSGQLSVGTVTLMAYGSFLPSPYRPGEVWAGF